MRDLKGYIEQCSGHFKFLSLFILFLSSISSSFGQDIWAWEVSLYRGSFSYKVVDGAGNQIFSPSSQPPAEIVLTGSSTESIPMGEASGGFEGFCWQGDINDTNIGIQWKVYVRPQPFSNPSHIPEEVCEGEMLNISILNDGYEGHEYSFWASLNGGPWVQVSEQFMESADQQKDFYFDFSKTSLESLFELNDPDDIYGSYRFKTEVSTCAPNNPIQSHIWDDFTELYKRKPADNIAYLNRGCPLDPTKIQIDWSEGTLNESITYILEKLLLNDECSEIVVDGQGYCSLPFNSMQEIIGSSQETKEYDLEPGYYRFTVERNNSCLNEPLIFEVTPLSTLKFSSTAHAPSCLGNNDGFIEVEILEGIPPYIFNGNEVASSFTIDGLSAGSFHGIISDNCYEFEIIEEINEGPEYQTIIIDHTDATCNANGSLEIATDYDGDQEVLFEITDGITIWGPQEESLFGNLPGGDFTVSTIINGQCYFNTNTTLDEPPDKIIGVDHRGQVCSNGDGAMVLYIGDLEDIGDSLYASYNLIGSGISGTVSGQNFRDSLRYVLPVPPGSYQLVIENECKEQNIFNDVFGIDQIDPVSIEPIPNQVISCADGISGNISFLVSNGTSPYTVSLEEHSITDLGNGQYEISGLGPGNYNVLVEDNCGISTSENFSVLVENGANAISLDQFQVVSQVSCPNSSDAILLASVTGGWPFTDGDKDYQVKISDEDNEYSPILNQGGRSEFIFENLGPGTYYSIVLDNNGCEKPFEDDIITILPPKEIEILEIKDTHFVPDQVKPDQDGNLMIQCHGDRVDFSPELGTDYHGGTGELTTMLELESVLVPFTNLGPGTYTFTVSDENDCSVSKLFELREPEEGLTALVTPLTYSHGKHIKCVGDENGEITVSISGGIPPYDFAINGVTEVTDDPDGNLTFSGLTAESPQTSYTIVATDYLGCQFEQVVNLEPPTKPTLDYTIISEVVGEYEIPCTGASATIRFTGSGGDETSQYRLQVNGEIVGLFDPDGTLVKELTAGIYTINMLDNLDCDSDMFELDLTEPDEPLSFTTTTIHPNCILGEDGSISIEVLGGVPSYQYSLDGVSWQEENLFPGLEAGEYEVFVKDNNECTASETTIVPDNPNPLTITHTSTIPPSCHHGTDGSITIQTTNFRLKEDNKLSYFISGGHYGDEVIEVVTELDPLQEDHFMTFENLWDTKDLEFVAENYEIWVEDFNECVELANQFMGNLSLEAPEPVRLGAEVTAPSCYNGENGWFVITAQGGVSPYEFSLDNASFEASNTSDNSRFIFPDLISGDYTVYVRDANFRTGQPTCLASLEVHVPQGMDMEVIERVQNISCVGGDDGAIEVDIETYYENLPFEYADNRLSLEWVFGSDPLSEGSSLANLSKGVYTLKMTYDQDSLVCRQQEDIAILGPNTPLSISSIKAYPTSCGEENDGRAIVNFSGGWTDSTTYYNLSDEGWTPILGSSIVINDLSLGNHSIKIDQSVFNCLDESSFAIQASKINIDTIFIQAPACSDGSNGIVILKASNVVAPRFIIADSSYISTSGTYSGLSSGKTYDLVVFDEANPLCISDTISFSFPSCEDDTEDVVIAGVPIIQLATCETAEDGDAQVIANGGLPPYNYMLDGVVVSNENLSNLTPGAHEVIVTDQLGKKDSTTFIMDTEDHLSISTVSTSKSTCPGLCDGSAIIVIEGGSGSNNVKWEDDIIGFERSDLCPGVYSFQVFDERNEACVLNGEVNISAYEPLAVEVIQLTKPTCPGRTNGKISVRGLGGSGSYSFEWGDGSKKSGMENISAGYYEVTLTDDLLNCSFVEEIELPDIPIILVSDTILGTPSCRGSTDGSIELVLENAVSPLLEWDDGAIGLFRENLSSGTYHFTVTTSNSCQISGEIILPDRDPLSVEVSKTDNHCFGLCEGTIDLSISGGLAPYYIEWSSGIKSLQRTQLCNGVYDYQVVDRLGCVVEGSVEIRSPDPLAIELLEKNDISCRGFGDGTLEVAATGGTGTYTYQWNSRNETQSIEGLQPGSYTVSVSDENGCSTNATYTITQPQSLFLKYENVVDPSCDGRSDGLIEIIASGGNSSYQYTWDDFSTDPLLDDLYEGNYQLLVEDEKGCTYGKTYTLEAPSPLSLINVQYHDPICFDESSGLISTEVIGGTGPYYYSWNSGHTTSTIEDIPYGEYDMTVTDKNGCTIASSFHLSNPEPLSIEGIEESVLLCDGGSVFISPEGNWEGYFWEGPADFSSTSHQIEASVPGEYLLSVENEDGCGVSKSFSIEKSESVLKADFIRISEALANEPLIFVDLSLPIPDQVEWIVPESDNIIVTSMDDQFIEIVFTKPGAYELGLVAYYKNCLAELFKTIHIDAGSGESINGRVDETDVISTSVYPNPTQGNIEVIINADTKNQLTAKLLNMTRDELVIENLSGRLDYLLQWDLSEVPSGVYFLVLQSGDYVQQKRILLVR